MYNVTMARLSEETCRLCFLHYGGWFGPPPATFNGSALDGRIRLHTLSELGWPSDVVPSTVALDSARAAIRWCVIAEHYERALDLCAEYSLDVDSLLPVALGIPPFVVAPLLALTKRRRRSAKRHKRKVWHVHESNKLMALAKSARESHRLLTPEEVLRCYDALDVPEAK